jgi:transposase-like protein
MNKAGRISKEIKDQILGRIKNDGVSIADVARDHGVSEKTIYGWLGRKVEGLPTWTEVNKLKREKEELLKLVGDLTLSLSNTQKKKSS